MYPFIVQHSSSRHARTEERVIQLFRILNETLERKKETRKRSLGFHTPAMIPLNPHVRIVQDDPSYMSLVRVTFFPPFLCCSPLVACRRTFSLTTARRLACRPTCPS